MRPEKPVRMCKLCDKVIPMKKGDYCDACRVVLRNGGKPPLYVCKECGTAYGEEKHQGGLKGNAGAGETQWIKRKCDVCGKKRRVTHYRKFGYLTKGHLAGKIDKEKLHKKKMPKKKKT